MGDCKNEMGRSNAQTLIVASYNIHKCRGWDFRRNARRIARVIEDLDADVIGLQEVHSRRGRGEDSHQADYLARVTGFELIAGPTVQSDRTSYGNLLLTRHHIAAVRHVDLRVRRREPRGAIDVDLDVNGKMVRVIVTHLGLRASERMRQVERLLSSVACERPGVTILLGDLNERLRIGGSLLRLETHFGQLPSPKTFPSLFPKFPLDRIFVEPREMVTELGVHDSGLARMASDHLPVKAVLKFG